MASNGKSNGVPEDIDAAINIGPIVGEHTLVGPPIVAEGWNQTYASPYVMPATAPTHYNGPWRADFTQGRHPFRTQPRTLGRSNAMPLPFMTWGQGPSSPTLVESAPAYAHGIGADDTAVKSGVGVLLGLVVGYLIVKELMLGDYGKGYK